MKEYLEEKWLLYRVQMEQDGDAFAELYSRYIDKIYRFIFFKISNEEEAKDLASDVFLKAWDYLNNRSREKQIQHFGGFIYRIARNAIIDVYRTRAKNMESSIDSLDEARLPVESPQDTMHTQMEAKQLLAVIKKMKQEYQDVLLLRYVEELSISEIAEILEKGQTAVRVTLHRATKKLKELSGSTYRASE